MVPCTWLLCLHPITFGKIATSRFFICTLAHWDFFHLMGCEDVLCMEKSDELRLPLGYEWICMVPCAWLLCLHPITFRKIATSRFFNLHPCTLGFFSFDGLQRCSLYGKEWWAATSNGLWMDLHGAMCTWLLCLHPITFRKIATSRFFICTLAHWDFFHLMGCEDVLCMEKSDELRLPLDYEWVCMVPCAWLLCSHPITFRKIATSRFFICTLAHWDFFHLMGCEDVLCMEKSDELRLPLGYEWICMVPCAWLLCLHPITFRKIATSRFFICTLAHWDFFHLMGCEDVLCMGKSDELRLPLGYEWICMAPCAWLLCSHPIIFRKIATSRFFICTLAHWDFFHLMGCEDVLCMEKSDELWLPLDYEWICMVPCAWLLCLHPITFRKIATSRFFICTLAHWDFFHLMGCEDVLWKRVMSCDPQLGYEWICTMHVFMAAATHMLQHSEKLQHRDFLFAPLHTGIFFIWWAAKMFFVWKRVMSCDFHWVMNGFAWRRVHGCCAHIP